MKLPIYFTGTTKRQYFVVYKSKLYKAKLYDYLKSAFENAYREYAYSDLRAIGDFNNNIFYVTNIELDNK